MGISISLSLHPLLEPSEARIGQCVRSRGAGPKIYLWPKPDLRHQTCLRPKGLSPDTPWWEKLIFAGVGFLVGVGMACFYRLAMRRWYSIAWTSNRARKAYRCTEPVEQKLSAVEVANALRYLKADEKRIETVTDQIGDKQVSFEEVRELVRTPRTDNPPEGFASNVTWFHMQLECQLKKAEETIAWYTSSLFEEQDKTRYLDFMLRQEREKTQNLELEQGKPSELPVPEKEEHLKCMQDQLEPSKRAEEEKSELIKQLQSQLDAYDRERAR